MPSPEDVPMEDGTNDENQPEQQQQLKVALTRQELVALIDQIDRTPMVVGETWCLVSQKWWTALNKAVRDGYVEDVPAIDNTPISDCVNGFFYLKQHMGEGIDYTPVPAPIFEKLSKMFQLEDDRRDYITRKVVMKNGEKVLEVYPRVIHVTLARSRDVKGDVILQPDDTMETLSQRVRTELALAPNENIRIYVSSGNSQELIDTSAPLDSYFDTVQKVIVDTEVEGEWFFRAANAPRSLFGPQNSSTEGDSELEEEEVDEQEEEEENEADVDLDDCKNLTNARAKIGTTLSTIKRNVLWPLCALWFHVHDFWFYFCQMWPEEVRSTVAFFFGWWILRPPSGTSARLGSGGFTTSTISTGGSSPVSGSAASNRQNPGQCGLSNLGNTCFMASALQCLSNTPPLRDFFLSKAFERDLNEDNPLGTRGQLAISVGDLLRGMWSGEYSSINPRRFKSIIGTFAPRFNGYSQQDAHELMAYVLDGLHEDLNRIKDKPYIEDNDEDAKLPEAKYAEKSWEMYKKRNDSIIVDTLHGQLRSTLICPVCEKISIKFDPFGYLSLPLPPKEQIVKQTVIVMFLERKWAKFSLGITENTTVEQAQELMMVKLQPETQYHFVFFYVPNPYSDDVVLLRPNEKVRLQGKEVYVAQVQHDLSVPGTRIFVAYNRAKVMRSCSLPMVYSLAPGTPLTYAYLNEHVFPVTKHFFINPKANLEPGAPDDDDSMSGNSSLEEREPYKLFIATTGSGNNALPLPLPPTNDPVVFPEENDERRRNDVYRNFVQIVFQWKEMKLFNQYKGADLIEREMTVSTRRKVELEETLNWFTTKEQLGEQDSWYCPQCKKHERATKQLDLWKLPEILILHLKRFQFTRWSREKLTWEVVVPVRGLDLTQKVANPNHEKAVYDLIAVSRHYGSLSGGHYTAIGYNDKIKKWIDFNDSCTHTMPAPPDPLESSDAYMLVYRRRKLDANGQPIDPMMSDQAPEYQSSRAKRAAARHQVDENMEMEED